jgi:alpha-galactosidase
MRMSAVEASVSDEAGALGRWARRVCTGEAAPEPGAPGRDGWWATTVPFSFRYGGIPSAELVPHWQRRQELEAGGDDRTSVRLHLSDPQTKLEVTWEATCYATVPAVEWLLHFRNGGTDTTPILEVVRALDLVLATDHHELVLYHATGGIAAPDAFEPHQTVLGRGAPLRLVPVGGRSSNGVLPYFNVEATWGGYRGVTVAIGWSGQWEARISRFRAAPPSTAEPDLRGPNPGVSAFRSLNRLRLEAGMEGVRLSLEPGERIRTPRILLIPWEQDRMRGQNRLRRFIHQRAAPKLDGAPPRPALFSNLGIVDPSGGALGAGYRHVDLAEQAATLGVDAIVLDAGWYAIPPHSRPGAEVSWVHGVGNYTVRPDIFPDGLRPLAEVAHRAGTRFGLWFEPERVAEGTEVFREHRDWLFPSPTARGYVFNLGLPEARRWLTDTISRLIDELGIGWYRHDANADYLPVWRANDPPHRQGVSEIRYVEGLYQFWADLLARHPGLYIEGCASGGRRMDYEALHYHHSQTHTDWIWGDPGGMQSIIHAGSHWLPGNYFNSWMGADGAPTGETLERRYGFFSALGGGMNFGWRAFNARTPLDMELGRRWMQEFRALRHLPVGDFYPLLPHTLSEGQWLASQYHRPDLEEGMVLAFRRRHCPLTTVILHPQALDPHGVYVLRHLSTGERIEQPGRALLAGLSVTLPQLPSYEVIHYRRVAPR